MPQRLDLVVGLGNPGPEYLLTRHNAGFWFVDALATQSHQTFKRDRKLHGETTEVELAGHRLRLLKPQTFMNESGRSVAATLAYYKIEAEHILVVYDELDLPPGRAKLKRGGGHAGHRGMRSIIEHVGADFWRLRLGIGHPGPGRRNEVIGHVLNRPPAADEQSILECIGTSLDILPVLIEQGGDRAMERLHNTGTRAAGEADD